MKQKAILFSFFLIFLVSLVGVQGIITDPVLYLNFSQTTGNITNATGGMSWSVPNTINQSAIGGLVGGSYNFSYNATGGITGNGSGIFGFITIPHAPWNSIDGKNITIIVLIRPETVTLPANQGIGIFGKGGNASVNNGLQLAINTGGGKGGIISYPQIATRGFSSFSPNSWNCIISNVDTNKLLSFGNNISGAMNVLSNNVTLTNTINNSDNFDLVIGKGSPNTSGIGNSLNSFNGSIDQFAMYNRVLSAQEMAAVCNNWSAGIDFINYTEIVILSAPQINFTAVNITSNAIISSFCVNGTGTNTSFSSCTSTGLVQNNLSGTYNYTLYNASGFQDQTVQNFVFSQNTSIQFNLTEINLAPVLYNVTLTPDANNQTLIESAKASDPNTGTSITYFWNLYRNNTLTSSGSAGGFTIGVLSNFNNQSTGFTDGTYVLEVIASDGFFNTSPMNSSSINVTFPRSFKINFTARNISDGFLNSFCVMGEGTNTFNLCTSNGSISYNFPGTYNFTGFNATGFGSQAVNNFIFDHNTSIQFNFTETNLAPLINQVILNTTDNITLRGFGNASDPNNDPVSFYYILIKDNVTVTSGVSSPTSPTILTLIRNFTASGNGVYILQLKATDGSLNSSAMNSTALLVTAPSSIPSNNDDNFVHGILLFMIAIAIMYISIAFDIRLGQHFEFNILLAVLIMIFGILIIVF